MLLIHIIIQFTSYSFNSIMWAMLQMILSTTYQVKDANPTNDASDV